MANPKFNVTIGETQKETIAKAAEILGVDMAEIVRIGAYRFALMVIDGGIDKGIVEQIEKGCK